MNTQAVNCSKTVYVCIDAWLKTEISKVAIRKKSIIRTHCIRIVYSTNVEQLTVCYRELEPTTSSICFRSAFFVLQGSLSLINSSLLCIKNGQPKFLTLDTLKTRSRLMQLRTTKYTHDKVKTMAIYSNYFPALTSEDACFLLPLKKSFFSHS